MKMNLVPCYKVVVTDRHFASVRFSRFASKSFAALLILVMLMLSACTAEEASRWSEAQATAEVERATEAGAVKGGEFNAVFPESHDEYEVVFVQEKIGFSEAILKEDGTEVATLSIFDTISNPEAVDKYAESDEEVEGYPYVSVGTNGSAILVADRFQVQVRSRIVDFTQDDCKEWLAQFDLAVLAGLE